MLDKTIIYFVSGLMYIFDGKYGWKAELSFQRRDHAPFFIFSHGATMYAMAKRGTSNGNGQPVYSGKAVLPNHGLPGLSATFSTILADPPWQFQNRTGKVAPEHKRLKRYHTMTLDQILSMPVANHAEVQSHLYLWVPNALLEEGLTVMRAWGFTYKSNIVWHKIRKDGGPDGRGVGFYFRNVTELVLFGIRGRMRTLKPGRTQVNFLKTRKQEHSRKPEEMYDIIEACSPGPYLELFARERRTGWTQWGDELDTYLHTRPHYKGYNGHTIKGPLGSKPSPSQSTEADSRPRRRHQPLV